METLSDFEAQLAWLDSCETLTREQRRDILGLARWLAGDDAELNARVEEYERRFGFESPVPKRNGDAGVLDDLSTEPLDPPAKWEELGRILAAVDSAPPEKRPELLRAARAAAGQNRSAHALVDLNVERGRFGTT